MYADKERQREANRQAAQRRRAKKGMTQGMTREGMTEQKVIPRQEQIVIPETMVDATGHEHPIDYAGRRKDWTTLEAWAKGEGGGFFRRSLGTLSIQYDILYGYRNKSGSIKGKYLGAA